MKRPILCVLWVFTFFVCGCARPEPPPQAEQPAPTPERHTDRSGHAAEVSFDTRRDGEFACFVQQTAGPLFSKVAVGIERQGTLRIQLGEATSPEDTLPLTKSLLAGARKDFPDKPITVSVYDPQGEPILKAYSHPEHGVRYEVARRQKDGQDTAHAKVAGVPPPRLGPRPRTGSSPSGPCTRASPTSATSRPIWSTAGGCGSA